MFPLVMLGMSFLAFQHPDGVPRTIVLVPASAMVSAVIWDVTFFLILKT
jgi:hypothetical protein